MDIAARIHQLEELIREAKSMPLSASVLVNKDEVLELVDGMRNTLPEEIKQARWVVTTHRACLISSGRVFRIPSTSSRTSSLLTRTEADSGIDFASRISSSSWWMRAAMSI